jgi:predicted glycoside hydrolase/deacetylase ChbG (UPF0249 family)
VSRLIVNADDFGRSRGINRGVLEAHDHGIVTSASLMAVWPASAEAAEAARDRPRLSIGLHFDLGEWLCRNGEWECTYLRVPPEDEDAVRKELDRQLRVFRRLVGRDPTHLDSHQHVHRDEPLRSILLELGRELDVPVRHESRHVSYRGDFFGQLRTGESATESVAVAALVDILATLADEITELSCHPGYANDLATGYGRERALEVETLCDVRVRDAIIQLAIQLGSFHAMGNRADAGKATSI